MLGVILHGCSILDPAVIEGRWAIDEVSSTSANTFVGIASVIVSSLVRGTTIEFRNGRVFIAAFRSDTLRFDYVVQSSWLELSNGVGQQLIRLKILRLDHRELRLGSDSTVIILHRLQ